MQFSGVFPRAVLAVAVLAGAVGPMPAANCKPCSNETNCCLDNCLSVLKSCCWKYGPCSQPASGGEEPVSRAPRAETACYDGARAVLGKCLDIVDPRDASCRETGDTGKGQQRRAAATKKAGYPFGTTIVWPMMRLARPLLSYGSWTYVVDVPKDVRATLVLANGVPRHDDRTGKLLPDLPPERRGVYGRVELDGEEIVPAPGLATAAVHRVPVELSAGRHRITFDVNIDDVEDEFAILTAFLEFD